MIRFNFLLCCVIIINQFKYIICIHFNIQTRTRNAIKAWNQHQLEIEKNRLCFNTTNDIPTDNRIVYILERYLGSRSKVAQLGKNNKIFVNGTNQHGTFRIKVNDVLEWENPVLKETEHLSDKKLFRLESFYNRLSDSLQFSPPLSVVYENHEMAIVFKPAGVHTMPFISTLRNNQLTLSDVLPLLLTPSSSTSNNTSSSGSTSSSSSSMTALSRPIPVHRLDNRVAGPVVIAKTSTARTFLQQCFEKRSIMKEYRAILCGCPDSDYMKGLKEQLELSLVPREQERIMKEGGKRRGWVVITGIKSEIERAISLITVVNITPVCIPKDDDDNDNGDTSHSTSCYSRVRLWPFSGKRHQLRKHCALLGCPIVGDDLYHDAAMVHVNKRYAAINHASALATATATATVNSANDDNSSSFCYKEDDYIVYEVAFDAEVDRNNDDNDSDDDDDGAYGGFHGALIECIKRCEGDSKGQIKGQSLMNIEEEESCYSIHRLDSLPSIPDNAKPSLRRRIGLYLQAVSISLHLNAEEMDNNRKMLVVVDELPRFKKLLDKAYTGWLFQSNKSHIQ